MIGSSEIGGAPKVIQCILLKPVHLSASINGSIGHYLQPVKMFNSEFASSAIMCANKRLATAPPAECPVIISEQVLLAGSSSSIALRRAATGLIILLATERNPE